MDILAVQDAKRRYAPLVYGVPGRDTLLAWYDFSLLTGSNGGAVSKVLDLSGNGQDVNQVTTANKPTLVAAAQNGLNAIRFGSTAYLARASFGTGFAQPVVAQPVTYVVVAKISSAVALTARNLIGSASGTRVELRTNATSDNLFFSAGSAGASGGPRINDDTWHVFVGVAAPSFSGHWTDGQLMASSTTQGQGSNALAGLGIGADSTGATPVQAADFGEVLIWGKRLSMVEIDAVTRLLAAKWGITVASTNVAGVTFHDTTDAGAINVRYWLPPSYTATTPLVIWCHPYTQNEQITPSYFAYPLVHAAIQKGWAVIGSRQHGDNWGNDNGVGDILAAYNVVTGLGITPSSVVLVGASMGGLSAMTAAKRATLGAGKVKGVVGVDAVFDLTWAYTGNGGAYATAINTAYGIANVGGIPAANDPMQFTAAQIGAIRFRGYASTSDTNADKTANSDAMSTKLAGGGLTPEQAIQTHLGGHLANSSAWPKDFAAFLARCA